MHGETEGNNKLLGGKTINFLFLFILIGTLFSLSNDYMIDFYGIDIMYVSDNTRDTLLLNKSVRVNSYKTQTKGPFDIIFPTNNIYTTYYSKGYTPIKYTKDINQFGNVNYRIDINDIKRNKLPGDLDLTKSLNIFSLLDYIEENTPNIENEKIIVQGGAVYRCHIEEILRDNGIIKYSLDFIHLYDFDVSRDMENVFTDHVFHPEGVRYVWVDLNTKRIERCKFKLGFMKLNARRIQ